MRALHSLLLLAALCACAHEDRGTPPPDAAPPAAPAPPAAGGSGEAAAAAALPRAKPGQHVWIVPNTVRASKRAQYERFLDESLWAALRRQAERDPKAAEALRSLRRLTPAGPDEDGNYTYALVMDPVVEGFDYEILSLLTRVYGEQDAQRRYGEYKDSLAHEVQEQAFVQRAP